MEVKQWDCANVRTFLEAKSESEYMELYESLKPTWDTLFREYYAKYLHTTEQENGIYR